MDKINYHGYFKSVYDNYYKFGFNIKKENGIKPISENALKILEKRYFMDKYDNTKEKTFNELCRRVARVVASGETLYTKDVSIIKGLELSIFYDMINKLFLFNSPALFSAGTGMAKDPVLGDIIYNRDIKQMSYDDYKILYNERSKYQMMFACFVLGIEDSLDGIFDTIKNAARVTQFGGGVGFDFSKLREKGSTIKDGMMGVSSGPVSFMKIFNEMGNAVAQGGKRRAAEMGMMRIDHPDVKEFIKTKTEDGELSYFNISVAIDDKFMNAVKKDSYYDLISPKNGEVVNNIKAKEIWNYICECAWQRGDPGVFFVDNANRNNILKYLDKNKVDEDFNIYATNPCGEQDLPNDTSCNLGSINLKELYSCVNDNTDDETDDITKKLDKFYTNLIWSVQKSVYYLDLIIDVTNYPLEKIEKRTKLIRPVGLGFMGLADLALKLGFKYGNNKEFITLCEKLANIFDVHSKIATISIGDIKGSFPLHEHLTNTHSDNKYPSEYIESNIRNSRRLSIAPTGSISMILDTSSGIEPNFAYEWDRKVVGSEDLHFYHDLVPEDYKNGVMKKLPEHFVTANTISIEDHLEVLKVFAQFVDSGISKTVNLPSDATVKDVSDIYTFCYENGIKGITIYRDGSREGQPIIDVNNKKEEEKTVELINNVLDRPKYIDGTTTKSESPYGSIYLTTNFIENSDKVFEIFASLGKSGTIGKTITEALSRVISIAVRSNTDIDEIIKTLKSINGSESWVIDTHNNEEILVYSIPDAIAKMLEDVINRRRKYVNSSNDVNVIDNITIKNITHDIQKCPECDSTLIMISGCKVCPSCAWSPCK